MGLLNFRKRQRQCCLHSPWRRRTFWRSPPLLSTLKPTSQLPPRLSLTSAPHCLSPRCTRLKMLHALQCLGCKLPLPSLHIFLDHVRGSHKVTSLQQAEYLLAPL